MKRLVSVLLILMSLISLASAGALASEEPAEEIVNFAEDALVPILDEESPEPETFSDPAEQLVTEDGSTEEPTEAGCIVLEGECSADDPGEISLDGISACFDDETLSNAVSTIREGLLAHKETITLTMKTTKVDVKPTEIFIKNEIIGGIINTLSREAVEHDGTPNGGDYLLWGLKAFGVTKYQYSYDPNTDAKTATYTFTLQALYYTTAEQEREIAAKINSILSGLKLDGKSDYDKVVAIHDWICNNVQYDNEPESEQVETISPLSFTAYNALFKGRAVCQGYSSLFYRMCLTAGVDCRVVAGTTDTYNVDGQLHSWNMVKLGDYYYYVDTTWDAAQVPYVEYGGDMYLYFCKGYELFAITYAQHKLADMGTLFAGKNVFNIVNYEVTDNGADTVKWTNSGTDYLVSKADYGGHDWGETAYKWNADHTECTATRTCEQDDCGETEVATASVTSEVTTVAGCETECVRIYTATFAELWAEMQTATESVGTLAHDWSEVAYTWNADKTECTAIHTCKRKGCGETEIATATITSEVTTAAKCATEGIRTYTAIFEEFWAEMQTATESIGTLAHDWDVVAYTWNVDHTECTATRICKRDDCNKTETATATISSEVTMPAECEKDGVRTYTAIFDEAWAETQISEGALPAIGHEWSEVTYLWSSDHTSCTAVRLCLRDDCETTDSLSATVTTATLTKPTCEEDYIAVYKATFDCDWAKTQSVTATIPAGHDYDSNDICTKCNCRKPKDLDGDGILGASDLIVVMKYIAGQRTDVNLAADINNNGEVDLFDLVRLMKEIAKVV